MLREGQRMLTTRLAEVEECSSVQNTRELMHRITRLETQTGGIHGGVFGETIRSCLMGLDGQAAELEKLRARVRARDWYHDLSEQESDEETRRIVARAEGQEANVENHSGVENHPFARRRVRNNAPHRRAPRMHPRTPQVLQPLGELRGSNVPEDSLFNKRMQRMAAFQQQCMDRVTQVDTRL